MPRPVKKRNFYVHLDEVDSTKEYKLQALIAILEEAKSKYGATALVRLTDAQIQPTKTGRWDKEQAWLEHSKNVNYRIGE